MASESTDPAAGPERIAFEVEGLEQSDPERVEVRGRWLGVRGRVFVRPALTVIVDGVQRRVLAELADKPWAPQPGMSWRAVFPLEVELAKASHVELTVAPDITVKLVDPGRAKLSRRRVPAPELLRAPRVRTDLDAPPPNLTEHARDMERLNSRLISAAQDLERERREAAKAAEEAKRLRERLVTTTEELERQRARRTGTEEELERQRSEALRLRAQLGQIQAELDLARAAHSEIASAAAGHEETSLALDRARAEAKQLRSQLAEARDRLARPAQSPAGSDRPGDGAHRGELPVRAPGSGATPEPQTQRLGPQGETERAAQARTERREQRSQARADREAAAGPPSPRPGAPGAHRPERSLPPRPERPLNPSLRHRTHWVGRVLAVLFILAVIAAVVLVIRSTGAV